MACADVEYEYTACIDLDLDIEHGVKHFEIYYIHNYCLLPTDLGVIGAYAYKCSCGAARD